MKNFRLLLMMAMITALSVVLVACADDSDVDPEADTEEGTEEDTEGAADEGSGGGDLIISEASDIVSLDPHGNNDVPSSNVRNNIYESLTYLDEDMEVQPRLATEWEEVDDTTWEFTLKEGVTFHDGTEFNAEVVEANLERILDPAVASPRMFLYEMVTGVDVVDDYTVQINLEYPFAPILAHLAHDAGGMISKEVIDADYEAALSEAGEDMSVEEYYELREEGGEEHEEIADAITEEAGNHIADNPVGTGPFELESRAAGENVVLANNADYHDEENAAQLDTVTFKVVPETGARLAEIETGSSHIAGAAEPSNIDRLESHDSTEVDLTPSLGLSYVGFNVEQEPLDDPLVRQAISYAIDREAIIEGIYEGVGTPAEGPLAPGVFGHDDSVEGITYDLDRAQELMEEAGHEDGFELEILTNDQPQRVDTTVYMQEALEELNIDVSVQQLEWGAYLETTANGDHDMFVLGWSTVTGDADYGLYALLHSSMHGDPGNRSFLADETVDELLEAGRTETDPDEREEIYSELQEELVEIAPMIYIHHQDFVTGVNTNVDNFVIDALGIYQLRETTVSE
ncbi:glutathione ABC transporter substrate-binding protein [Lacicoccus alkaliphilus]|uniref:Peptide/nickel transport system substrate-binding protein n=1 Tax=Lacicoccus alkaliphilus DSM 16010 TaxID=1123231 RepID=A0A1M7F370_9BACL|nr:glutathione ABC transporter substrate-binding protein [Salinicoccus alkaliphilus]SHL98107.1 peptide/nickel transport system substrate-binding protein [Salinicoccus alkaliphilus DSM 16010]